MRHLHRTMAALVGLACALAISAAPALAHEFVASKLGKVKGVNYGPSEFHLGKINLTCQKAKAKGNVAPGARETFFTSIKYKECTVAGQVGGEPITLKAKFKTPVAVEYHANGFVEIGTEGELSEGTATLSGGEVEIGIKALRCEIFWEEQTVPIRAEENPNGEYEEVTFRSQGYAVPVSRKFPTGEQQKLVILNDFKKMVFEYGEGQCESWKKPEEELHKGNVVGVLVEELSGGNLEFH